MRSAIEIQRAHDILVALRLGEVPNVVADEDRLAMHAALDVLCWVLEHDHNRSFNRNLDMIEEALARRGYSIQKKTGGG